MFEGIEWLKPKEIPRMELSAVGKLVEDALKVAEVHHLFERKAGDCAVYLEQAVEVILHGKWITGVVDRLLVEPEKVTVIDFKTDQVNSAGELRSRYRAQMEAYGEAMGELFEREVECLMVSTHLKAVVGLDAEVEQAELGF